MEHRLKILPEYFDAVSEGDALWLEEWDGTGYTGRTVKASVGYVLRGEYCRDGYCVMGIRPTAVLGFDLATHTDCTGLMEASWACPKCGGTMEPGELLPQFLFCLLCGLAVSREDADHHAAEVANET